MDKEAIVAELLERQKLFKEQAHVMRQLMDEIEPFSWMDDQVRIAFANSLTTAKMQSLDRTARASLAGSRLMARVFLKANAASQPDIQQSASPAGVDKPQP